MRVKEQRRGVTLLFVVSMIVMFMLLATTFLVISSQYLRGARSYANGEIFEQDPVNELDQAFYILLRDTLDENCPIRGHSLLGDLYGWLHGFSGTIQTAQYDTQEPNQHFVQLDVNNIRSFSGLADPVGNVESLLAGRVVTITSGEAKGIVGRILANETNTGTPFTMSILFERGASFRDNDDATTDFLNSLQNANFVVNGPAFQGKGAGFDPNANANAGAYGPEAIMPNRTGDNFNTFMNTYVRTNNMATDGDLNESWDAADYQNMFLSAQVPFVDINQPANLNDDVFGSEDLPSFYRPNLTSGGGFRPLQGANPNFPTLQPNSSPFGVEFDVDNDGDLLKDSVWVDFNLPVVTDKNGRTYKRMFAILVRDMDGKLNLNAHSNAFHEDLDAGNGNFAFNTNLNNETVAHQNGAGANESQALYSFDGLVGSHPRGQGWGPPEVNLRTVVRNNVDFKSLQYGRDTDGDMVVDTYGRNGYDNNSNLPRPGLDGSIDGVVDLHFGDVPVTSFFENSYGSFWDIHGRAVIGHDFNGHPRFSLTNQLSTERENTEYERRIDSLMQHGNASRNSIDMPFSYGELERVLRGFDNDSSTLPSRITDLMPNTFNLVNNAANRAQTFSARSQVTTHGFDIPVPPSSMRKYYAEVLADVGGITGAASRNIIEANLPDGILYGSKMDINFPFGNGRDDNGNGLVDEAWGAGLSDYLNANLGDMSLVDESYVGENYPAPYNAVPFDHDADGVPANDVDAFLLRNKVANHIYILARLIFQKSIDDGLVIDDTTVPDVNNDGMNDENDLSQWLAQWAINTVDFRDSDSIMTPFEYDVDPFNGITVDNNPVSNEGAERGIVFGCERPDLLITETIGVHDRRTEDRDTDDGEEETAGNQPGDDNDFDQRLLPVGSMMLELWNPNSTQSRLTPDVYSTERGTYGVDLARVSRTPELSDGPGAGVEQVSPVWRVVITISDFDLDNPPPAIPNSDYERVIYFVPVSDYANNHERLKYGLPFTPNANNTFTPTEEVRDVLHPVGPLKTAVVGTGHLLNPTSDTFYITPMGRRSDADEATDLNLAQTRGFILDAAGRELTVREFDGTNVNNYSRSTEVIPIENLNISEPTNGYSAAGYTIQNNFTVVDGTFGNLTDSRLLNSTDPAEILDTPLDQATHPNNGTRQRYRYVHLQRLANPLVGWDADNNPYRTIDSMSVDLHVFNGAGGTDPDLGSQTNRFGTRERGEVDEEAGRNRRLLWSSQTDRASNLTDTAIPVAGDNHFYSFFLESPTTPEHEETLGEELFNNNYETIINYSYDYVNNALYNDGMNQVAKEFPSLTWNNRPYVSQYEMMLVPYTSSSQLLRQFSVGPTANEFDPDSLFGRYRHLVNFFQSTSATNNAPTEKAGNLYQLFDYLHSPTKFTDFQNIQDPTLFATNSTNFKPPFNKLPNFREPGRVNLNSVFTEQTFNGLKGGEFERGGHHGDGSWVNFVNSRKGNATSSGETGVFHDPNDSGRRSYFGNPFRSGGDGNLVNQSTSNSLKTGADASLMRSDVIGSSMPSSNGLFDAGVAFNTSTLDNTLHNPNRHPYLRYKNRVRLGNLTTTRSNVYAVWITVGYFEYDETNNQLGAEIGSESGQVERHRAFYMVDRSIPVGFEPGKNHNVDKAVMLRRYIE